jgi:hypothetical protein
LSKEYEFKREYAKVHKDVVEYTTPIIKRSLSCLCIIVIISKMD